MTAPRKKRKQARSRGAFELARLGLTDAQISDKLKCQRDQVNRWRNGDRRPSAPWRNAFLMVFGIEAAAWDEAASADMPAAAKKGEGEPVRELAARVRRMLDAQLSQIEADRSATPLERARVMASVTSSLKVLGAITGEAQQIGESRILRLPAWRRIEDALVAALKPWPKAGRAVATRLQELREG